MGWSEESRKSAGIRLKQKIRSGEFPHYEGGFKGPHRQDSKQKMSEARILLWRDQNYLNKMAERNSIISKITKEKWEDPNYKERVSKKISDAMKGKAFSEQHKQSLREAPRRSSNSELQRRTASELLKKEWEYNRDGMLSRIFTGRCKNPNKQELELEKLLDKYFPNEWKYVGNGQVWIARKCPDFININHRKLVIEYNGEYWHQGIFVEAEQVNHYGQYGFGCIVIWEHELGKSKKLIHKIRCQIRKFAKGGIKA